MRKNYVKKICKNLNWLTNIKMKGNAIRRNNDDDYEHMSCNRNKQRAWKLY
jgi:hypothetical protein